MNMNKPDKIGIKIPSTISFLDHIPEIIGINGPVQGEVGFFVGCMFNGGLPERAMNMIEVMKRV